MQYTRAYLHRGETRHNLIIVQPVLATACPNALYPERAKISLLDLSVSVRILKSLVDLVLCDAKTILVAPPKTLGQRQNLVVPAQHATTGTTFRHEMDDGEKIKTRTWHAQDRGGK